MYNKLIKSVNLNKFVIIFCIITIFFFIINQLKSELFENGIYSEYTLSMIHDQDFNIINTLNPNISTSIATESGNHPAFSHNGISVYLYPFYSAVYLYSHGSVDIENYKKIHVYFGLIVNIFSLLLLWQIMVQLKLKSIFISILIFSCSSSFFWYSIFEPTTPDTFANLFSLLTLIYFISLNEKNVHRNLFLGLACGLGFCIRIHLLWIGSLFLLNLYNTKKMKDTFYFIPGFLLSMLLFTINNSIRSGTSQHPLSTYFFSSKFIDFFDKTLFYANFGPNGYITVNPIYLFCLAGFFCAIFLKNTYRNLILCMGVPICILFIIYNSTWVISDEYSGRLLTDYYFFYVICLCILYDYIEKLSKNLLFFILTISAGMCAWHIYATIVFHFFLNLKKLYVWQIEYNYFNISLKNVTSIVQFIAIRFTQINVYQYIPYLIFNLIFAYVLTLVTQSQKNIVLFFKIFILYGFICYAIFTILNVINNPKNVELMRSSGFYQNKVIGNSNSLFFYDDLTEEYKKNSLFYLVRKNCVMYKKIDALYLNYLSDVKKSIISDPIHFVDSLDNNLPVFGENKKMSELFFSLKKTCP